MCSQKSQNLLQQTFSVKLEAKSLFPNFLPNFIQFLPGHGMYRKPERKIQFIKQKSFFIFNSLPKKGSVLLWFFQTLKNKNVYLRSQKNLSGTGTILIHTERYHNIFFFFYQHLIVSRFSLISPTPLTAAATTLREKKKNILFPKECGLAVLTGLAPTSHSLALSHYQPTRELLAAGSPPWPVASLLRQQPDPPGLPQGVHVDAGLSADTGST